MPAEGIILSGVSFRDETVIGWPSGESLKWVPKVKAGHSSRESLRQKDSVTSILKQPCCFYYFDITRSRGFSPGFFCFTN